MVTSYKELLAAIKNKNKIINIVKSFLIPVSIELPKNTVIKGNDNVLLTFPYSDGFILTKDNSIEDINIQTLQKNRAILYKDDEINFGAFTITNIKVSGMIQILNKNAKKGELNINNVEIISADTRVYAEQPHKYGVNVYQGALTVYNYNDDSKSIITANIKNISLGTSFGPVIGSGIFISGKNNNGGKVKVEKLITKDIYVNGMIPEKQSNLITGAIFILENTFVKSIETLGKVHTYGNNDMALDVWGNVDSWFVDKEVVTHGVNAIGFVNFGKVNSFKITKPIITYGNGARGFNQYDGTIKNAFFESIETFSDGAVGIQISMPVGNIVINKDITTHGQTGDTLVKGEIIKLAANPVSFKNGALIDSFEVKGRLKALGKDIEEIVVEDKVIIKQIKIEK